MRYPSQVKCGKKKQSTSNLKVFVISSEISCQKKQKTTFRARTSLSKFNLFKFWTHEEKDTL